MKRIRLIADSVVNKSVTALFAAMMFLVVIVTAFFGKHISFSFPCTAPFCGIVYYLAAVGILLLFRVLLRSETKYKLSRKQFLIVLIGIGVFVAVLQLVISLWMPVKFAADFEKIRDCAFALNSGGTLRGNEYFETFSNNVDITILFSWILSVVGHWRVVVFLGALLVNSSVCILAFCIYRETDNVKTALFFQIFGEIFLALTWRAFIPYTDNYCMPMISLMLFFYTSKLSNRERTIWISVVASIGMMLKPTILIPVFAMLILLLTKPEEEKRSLMNTFITSLIVLSIIIVTFVGKSVIHKSCGYEKTENTRTWQYWLMIGQDTKALGTVSGGDRKKVIKRVEKTYDTKDERMSAYAEQAKEWFLERGIKGNLEFYVKKLYVAFCDGYFHNMMRADDLDSVDKNFLYHFYVRDGKYYAVSAALFQLMWSMILVLLCVAAVRPQNDQIPVFLKTSILGIVMYLMVFEDRSKYLYMFLPIFLFLAALAFVYSFEKISFSPKNLLKKSHFRPKIS